jgi:hypothetical protein
MYVIICDYIICALFMFGTPTIPIGTPTIGMATTIKVAELPNLSIIPCCVKRLGAVHGKP